MSVNKSQTPAWMRVVIIIVVISFVGAGVAVVWAGISGGGAGTATSGTGTSALFAESYQPRVDAAMLAMESSPDNPDVIAQVGHAYYEWAAEVYQSGQMAASIPFWLSAVSFYDKVLAIDPNDEIVLGNKAFALYYAQSELAPAAIQAFLDGAAGSTALAAQLDTARGMLAELAASPVQSAPTTTTPSEAATTTP
jgi:hypothetical protein